MMRKWLFAIVALFLSASAQAHVSAVPFPEIGSLNDVTHQAAFAIHTTYLLPAVPQITCNMGTGVASVNSPCVTPPAAGACNGDVQTVTRTVTMVTTPSPANKNLNVSVNTFTSGDVGKTILVPGAAGLSGTLTTTITAFVDAQNVTLSSQAFTAVSGISTVLIYGTDDAPAFAQFNVWALANQGSNQVVQTLPTSGNCWFGTQSGGGAIKWVAGIKNLLVDGNSTTLNGLTVGWYFGSTAGAICSKPLSDAAGCTARIQTASSGASQLSLTSASFSAGYISRFSVNQWILVAGLNPQEINGGGSGYPPNPAVFEWRQITAICNNTGPCSGGATLTLNQPLTNSYLDTWPAYNTSAGEADAGGPATVYAMNDAWNTAVEYRNLTMLVTGSPGGNGRSVTYRNVSFDGSTAQGGTNNCGALPSQNETFAAYNTNWSYCTIETDKIITNFILDGATVNRIDFQSSSVVNFTMSNSTVTSSMFGTAQNSIITDTSFNTLRAGSTAYGNSKKLVCTRCNVTTFDGSGGIPQGTTTDYSKVGSVLQFLNTAATGSGPPGRIWAPLNSNIFYVVGGSFGGSIGLTTVTAQTQDATNTYGQTTDTVAFPPPFTSSTGAACCSTLTSHPAPQFTCDACTGDATLVAMNIQQGATALAPLGQFSKASYAPTSIGIAGNLLARGRIVSLTIDVPTAATGAGNSALNPTGQSHQETVKQSNWTPYDWVPTINLKQTGTRVITPSGTTCNGVTGTGPGGSCAGDSCTLPASGCFTLPEAVWIKSNLQPNVNSLAGTINPQFTITIQTDQGVVP